MAETVPWQQQIHVACLPKANLAVEVGRQQRAFDRQSGDFRLGEAADHLRGLDLHRERVRAGTHYSCPYRGMEGGWAEVASYLKGATAYQGQEAAQREGV